MNENTRKQIFENLGSPRLDEGKHWSAFLAELSISRSISAIEGILHAGATDICMDNVESGEFKLAEIFVDGIRLFLDIGKTARNNSLFYAGTEEDELSLIHPSIAKKTCSVFIKVFLSEDFYRKLIRRLTAEDATRIIDFLADPHHYIDKQPHKRKVEAFLLKLWKQSLRVMSYELAEQFDRDQLLKYEFFGSIRDNFESLVMAMLNWGLSDTIVDAYMSEQINKSARDICIVISTWLKNHPYVVLRNLHIANSYIQGIYNNEAKIMEPAKKAVKALLFFEGTIIRGE